MIKVLLLTFTSAALWRMDERKQQWGEERQLEADEAWTQQATFLRTISHPTICSDSLNLVAALLGLGKIADICDALSSHGIIYENIIYMQTSVRKRK